MFRVDARWPRLGVDILVGDIPATTGVVSAAVSFTKGCYPGQELVERMDSRGADAPVNLRVISRDGVGVGSRVEVSPQDTGTVTSVGFTKAFVRVGRGSQIGESLGRLA
jgi:folate-binding protein YgfZ